MQHISEIAEPQPLSYLCWQVNGIDAEFLLVSSTGVTGQSDGAMYGHACASKSIAVAAIDWTEGDGGAFEGR